MKKTAISRLSLVCLVAAFCPALCTGQQVFGTKDYTVIKIPATSFLPADSSQEFHTSGSLGRYGAINTDSHFYAPLELPSGATVDYIGINNLNDGTPGIVSATIRFRNSGGSVGTIWPTVSSTPHVTWATDKNPDPFAITLVQQSDSVFLVDVETASSPNLQFFGDVEIWWKRNVSDTTAQTFSDVPVDHPFHKFVEALYDAGITGGYPDGRFGVDDPVTRGQMAVFISIALGLHFPN